VSVARVKTKTEVATIKLTPQCRAAWETAAAVETRSLANMFEVAILDYCKRHDIALPAAAPEVALSKPAKRRRPSNNPQEG
jgi:hypothetical protein